MKPLIYICTFLIFLSTSCQAENILWSGNVEANGNPTEAVGLELFKKYKIRVSGVINLGKWIQNREKLANDACFEFNPEEKTTKIMSIRNSMDISVCNNQYNSNHIYESPVFKAEQNKIHFWIEDSDYDDNSGSFQIQIIKDP